MIEVGNVSSYKINIPRFPTLAVVIASVLTCLSIVWLGFFSISAANQLRSEIDQSLRAFELRGMILQLDEALTMSAKMYASTGDRKWAARYRRFDPILDKVMQEASRIISQKDLKAVMNQAGSANGKLAEMEHKAFHFVKQGSLERAKQILLGADYNQQKKIYAAAMDKYADALKKQAKRQINDEFGEIFYLSLILAVGFSVSFFAWLLAFRNIRNWKVLLTQLMMKEIEYKKDLEESRRFLELRVKERTDELESLNQSLQSKDGNLTKINKALKESETRFHLAIESTPVGMAILTLEGQFVEVNQALCTLFGYSKTEMLEMKSQDITYPEDVSKETELLEKLVQGKLKNFHLDKRYLHKDGRLFWVLLNASLLKVQTGKPSQLIFQVQDITHRKQYEKEILELNDAMSEALNKLKEHEHEMSLLNKMNEMLQACQSSQEAYSIIDVSAKEIFSGEELSGALAIFNKNRKNLEVIGKGGAFPNIKTVFSPDDCWSIRMGHVYVVDDTRNSQICRHFESMPEGGYICIPLIVRNQMIGLLNQSVTKGATITKSQQQLSIAFSDVIKLSLANIKMREVLQEESIHDPLTGLFNRRYLNETLPRELQRIVRENHTLSVAMIDLDFFKRFNDNYGHDAGDEVLKVLSKLLLNNFRGSDVVCRFGGEEFVVILLDDHFDDSVQKIQRLQAEVKKEKIFFQDRLLPPITLSIGLAQAPLNGTQAEDLIRAADVALYTAKSTGRDKIEIFHAQ